VSVTVLVTGGGGFVGMEVCRQLTADGVAVRSLSRSHYPALDVLGVEQVQADLADAGAVSAAAAGCEAVFHVAAKAEMAGPAALFERVNVLGTRNVIAACRAQGVGKLIHTSTPSVVHDGGDARGLDESAPYATRFLAHYPRTKAIAEREVLAANDADLATVALRPHLVWGPGDPHFLPQLLARSRSGELRLVGDGSSLVDSVFIEDAARAHVLAYEQLDVGAACAGRAYFITQGEPLPMRELINRLLAACDAPPVERSVPPTVAWLAGALFEGLHAALGRDGVPRMTRFVARQLATAHYFDISAARRDLGYEPAHTMDEALAKLRSSWVESGSGKS
jgi:2-alkyl-3-oxoalkanoate reductase